LDGGRNVSAQPRAIEEGTILEQLDAIAGIDRAIGQAGQCTQLL
jgi:hypothetical protein